MKKILFSLFITVVLFISIISCKKENNRITNSTYTIDSIEVFIDSIKKLSLIPGDLSVFDSIKQMHDTTAYYLFSNYYVDGNIDITQVGGTSQKPRFLIKNNKLIFADNYVPTGMYGQDGNTYRKIEYHYNNSNKLDSINSYRFYFHGIDYNENLFFNVTRNPDSMSLDPSNVELVNEYNFYYNYNGNNFFNIYSSSYYQTTPIISSTIQYSNVVSQHNLIGIDVNSLTLGLFSNGWHFGYGGTNFLFSTPIMLVNLHLDFGTSDNLISSFTDGTDTLDINYDFDTANNNRIKSISFPFSLVKIKYIFHYHN